jgi:2-methylcitrate dehydratase PrpD
MAEREPAAAAAFADVPTFARTLAFSDLPSGVVRQAQRLLLDLLGVAAAGSRTPAAALARAYAATQLAGTDHVARILFDGARASLAGAAFAGATTIDAIDAHDGHALTKGHAGAAVLPALLAYVDDSRAAAIDGREFITCLVLGYEVATRAGIALHATVPDYHCSGAWNALACAAIGGRRLRLDHQSVRHALGIAEYFGPRGQILRVCSSPTMLKDGSGWGAHAGVSAAMLAQAGFTGAPALTVEGEAAHGLWSDLGTRWLIGEQYLKAYPVCRWAHPAVEAALALQRTHGFAAADVRSLAIASFRQAIELGAQCPRPATSDEAQYSLRYAVAAALVFGRLSVPEIDPARLGEAQVARLSQAMTLGEDAALTARFPGERLARVSVTLFDGRTFTSPPTPARGSPDNPLSDDELQTKFRDCAQPVLGATRAAQLERAVAGLTDDASALDALTSALLAPVS